MLSLHFNLKDIMNIFSTSNAPDNNINEKEFQLTDKDGIRLEFSSLKSMPNKFI